MRQEVAEGSANWDVMTNRYFDTVEQLDILSKADEFLSEVRRPETSQTVVILCLFKPQSKTKEQRDT